MITQGHDSSSGGPYHRVVDASTGKTVTSADHVPDYVKCYFDGASVTACATDSWTGAMDATTGTWLWQLPDENANRTSIRITAAWHGAIYGTTGNGPLILDARTGADRQTSPGAAPHVLNDYVGIAQIPREEGLFAFPAVG